MDFFAQQDKARRKTKWLVFYFILAVVLLIVARLFRRAGRFCRRAGQASPLLRRRSRAVRACGTRKFFLASTLGVLAVIFIGSAYKTMALAAGGSAVAESMGGRLVNPNTTDPTSASCSTSSRKCPSPPACRCRRSMCSTTRTASTPSPPATRPATPPSP